MKLFKIIWLAIKVILRSPLALFELVFKPDPYKQEVRDGFVRWQNASGQTTELEHGKDPGDGWAIVKFGKYLGDES
jgi:hypothetical protein